MKLVYLYPTFKLAITASRRKFLNLILQKHYFLGWFVTENQINKEIYRYLIKCLRVCLSKERVPACLLRRLPKTLPCLHFCSCSKYWRGKTRSCNCGIWEDKHLEFSSRSSLWDKNEMLQTLITILISHFLDNYFQTHYWFYCLFCFRI